MEKVEPPNWWAPHTYNPVQVLVTGTGLHGATVTSASKNIKTEIRFGSEDGRYLFVYLDIARNAAAGAYRFEVKSAKSDAGSDAGGTSFTFALERPLDARGRFQGFSPDDVIYLLMPDRFANGDPSNDSPPEFGRPADRNTVPAYHGGDLRGVREHLGYLKDLGVTGIWMTPVYKNSNTTASPYHGYHTVDFFDVEPLFGTMAEFRGLVDAAHAAGIKVVEDHPGGTGARDGGQIPKGTGILYDVAYHMECRILAPRRSATSASCEAWRTQCCVRKACLPSLTATWRIPPWLA